MYRVHLTDEQQHELHRRAHQPGVAPRTRDRLEMVRLSARGWSVPKIAAHLGQHEQTVRQWVKAFLGGGFAALGDQPHTGQKSAVTPAILADVRGWLDQGDRTWSARQIAAQVSARYAIARSLPQWRRLLRREGLSYKRTRRTLRHKQDPAQVATFAAEAERLKGGPTPGG